MKRRCCRFVLTVGLLVLAIVGGGLLLWRYLPETATTIAGVAIQDGDEEPTYVFQKCDTNSTNCCNGLDSICDLRADQIMYAGVHNSMATLENGFLIAPNHLLSLEKALVAGYRAINLDVGRCDGQLRFMHEVCQLGYRDPKEVFTNIAQFLLDNPSENIILNFQVVEDVGESVGDPVRLDELSAIIDSVPELSSRLYSLPVSSLTPWPTLRQMRTMGKQVLLFFYNMNGLCRDGTLVCPPGYYDWFVYAKETQYVFSNVEEVEDTARACAATRGTKSSTIFGVNIFLSIPSRAASQTMNSIAFLQTHMPACADLVKQAVNVVFVDFWSRGDLPLYVQRQNTMRANAAKTNQTVRHLRN
jgi:hypothetical protein